MRFNFNELSIIHLNPICLPKVITRKVSMLQKLTGMRPDSILLSKCEERKKSGITMRKMMLQILTKMYHKSTYSEEDWINTSSFQFH